MRLLLLLAVAGFGCLAAQAVEAWVVNEGSKDITVIEADGEQVLGTIDLSDVADPPWCVAFSTAAGLGGQFAFVSQGPLIRVVDVQQRGVIHSVDIGSLLGSTTVLRGCAADRPRNFLDGQTTEVRSYLHVAAGVENLQGVEEPSFLVLDQDELIQNPQGQSVIVDSGVLMAAPNGEDREATDVTMMGLPHGDRFQRAWYSIRELSPTVQVHAAEVYTEQQLGQYLVESYRTNGTQAPLPDSLGIAAPYDRELPIQALGALGRLLNVDSGDFCDIGGNVRGVKVAGMGPGSHTVFAIADGSPGELARIDPQDCSGQIFTVGDEPVDLEVLDLLDWTKVFVANRGSDTVTVVRDDDSQATIPVGTDPRSVEVDGRVTFCFVTNQRLVRPGDGSLTLLWDSFGCPEDQVYRIGCVCFDPAAGCPSGCEPAAAGAGTDAADRLEFGGGFCDGDWKPLDSTAPGVTSYNDADGDSGGGHCYNVWPI